MNGHGGEAVNIEDCELWQEEMVALGELMGMVMQHLQRHGMTHEQAVQTLEKTMGTTFSLIRLDAQIEEA